MQNQHQQGQQNQPQKLHQNRSKNQSLDLKHKIAACLMGAATAVLVLPFATIYAQTAAPVSIVSSASTTAATSTLATASSTSATSTALATLPPNAVFSIPVTQAASVSVFDVASQQFIYQKNADQVRSLASITKVLTAMIAEDILGWNHNPPKTITLNTIDQNSIIDRSLRRGEQWSIYDLLPFMLITSSNTAAETIGGSLIPYSSFISLMNFTANKLGFNTIKATDTSGLPIDRIVNKKTVETAGAVGSANDMAKLMAYAYQNYSSLITVTTTKVTNFQSKLNGRTIDHIASSTDQLLSSIPEIVAGKTGFTDASGGNLAVVIMSPQQTPVVIVVLGSTVDGRFTDVAALASSTKDFFTVK